NLNNIADTYLEDGNYSAAESCYNNALEVARAHCPQTNRSTCEAVLSIYRNYIGMVRSLKEDPKLKPVLEGLKRQDPDVIKAEAMEIKKTFEKNEASRKQTEIAMPDPRLSI